MQTIQETWMTEDLPQVMYPFLWGAICWRSMVHSLVLLSTTESKYIVVIEAAKEVFCLIGLVKEIGIQQGGFQLNCELVSSSDLLLEKFYSSENAANMSKKSITTDKFKHYYDLINVSNLLS